jgi:hypothetical protein
MGARHCCVGVGICHRYISLFQILDAPVAPLSKQPVGAIRKANQATEPLFLARDPTSPLQGPEIRSLLSTFEWRRL